MVVTARIDIEFNRFPYIRAALKPRAEQITRKAAMDLQALAQRNAPVDTGYLRSSIRAEPAGDVRWQVIVGAHYGIYVEFGTRYMRAQPFLDPAAEVIGPQYIAAMRQLVSGL